MPIPAPGRPAAAWAAGGLTEAVAGRPLCAGFVSNDGIAAVAAAGDGGLAAGAGRVAAPEPPPDVGPGDGAEARLDGAGVTGLPYVVPWLFEADLAAPFCAESGADPAPAAAGVAAGADDAVFLGGCCLAGLEIVGLELAAGPEPGVFTAFVGVDEAPVAGVAPPPGFPAGFVTVDGDAEDPGVPGFAGCFGAAGFVDELVVLFRPASRDGAPVPPTVALPTVALPIAAEARAGPPEL